MAKIKKAIDWEGDFLNIYDQIERKDLSPSAIEHKWTPFGIKKEGTAVNAELLNDFQKNGIYGTLNTVKEIINSVERYIIKDFYGIEEFGVFEELKLKIKISDANNEDNPKLVLNSIEYSMIYSTETSFVNIKKGQLEKNKIYNLIFNGVAFIVESSSLKATADSSGLMSLSDVRKEIANLSGASYSGIFGSELKNIIAGNSYLYIDSNGKGIICKALNTKINSSGFLVPNSSDFIDITNNNLNTIMNVKTNVISAPWILFDVLSGATNETILNIGRPFRLASVLLKIDKFAVMDQEVSLIIPWNLEARFRTALPTLSPSGGQVIASDWNRIHVKIISEGQNLRVTAGNQDGASHSLKVTVLKIDIIN